MARKFTKVLTLMQQKGGRLDVTDPDIEKVLGHMKKRIPGYMSNIRKRGKLEVRAIRNGRKVVAYELVGATVTTPESQTPAAVVIVPVESAN